MPDLDPLLPLMVPGRTLEHNNVARATFLAGDVARICFQARHDTPRRDVLLVEAIKRAIEFAQAEALARYNSTATEVPQLRPSTHTLEIANR